MSAQCRPNVLAIARRESPLFTTYSFGAITLEDDVVLVDTNVGLIATVALVTTVRVTPVLEVITFVVVTTRVAKLDLVRLTIGAVPITFKLVASTYTSLCCSGKNGWDRVQTETMLLSATASTVNCATCLTR